MTESSKNKPQVCYKGTGWAVDNAHDAVKNSVRAFHRLAWNTLKVVPRVGIDQEQLCSQADSILGHAREVVTVYRGLASLAMEGKHGTDEWSAQFDKLETRGVDLGQAGVDLVSAVKRYEGWVLGEGLRDALLAQAQSVDAAATALNTLALYFASHDRRDTDGLIEG